MYIGHFEVVRETGSRWLLSALWDYFGGTHFQHGSKFVPRNCSTVHFDNHLDPCNLKVANMKVSLKGDV